MPRKISPTLAQRETVTVVEVAKYANVSITTVSRALSQPDLLAPATLERVLQAIETLNYHPNRLARGLRLQQSGVVGLVGPDISSPFQAKVTKGVQAAAAERGYQVFLYVTDEDPEREQTLFRTLRAYQLQGLLLIPSSSTENTLPYPDSLPVIEIDRTTQRSGVSSFLVNNVGGAKRATEHLIALGHRRIATVTGKLNLTTGRERLLGYEQALTEAGLRLEPAWIAEGGHLERDGYSAAQRLFSLPESQGFTALFAANSEVAAGTVRAVQERGLRIPEDLSLVLFDDSRWARLSNPPFTVVAQPAFDLGYSAGQHLFDRLEGRPHEMGEQRLETELIVRGSTASPRLEGYA